MSNNYLRVFKEVISNKNVITIALTTSLISLTGMAYRPYWSAYLKDVLMANTVAIGLLSSISSSENLLFQLPGGILADRYGRRKIIIIGTALRIFPPLIYLFASHWTHIIPAVLLTGTQSIYMPAFNAIIADSLPEKRRGAGYGAYRMITAMPQFISPIIGGLVMDQLGYEQGIQAFMILEFFINIFVTYARWRMLNETIEFEDEGDIGSRPRIGIMDRIKTVFTLGSTVKILVLVTFLSSVGMMMVWNFLTLYALKILNFTNTQIGLVTTVGGLISLIFSMPAGMLSDRFGRKPMILISRTVSPLVFFGITQVTYFNQYFMIQLVNSLGNAMGGGGMWAGGPAWNALVSELVPKEKLATVMGSIGTISGIIAVPSPIIGGWLWDEYSPKFPFYVASFFGLLGAIVFALKVKEPQKKEET